MERIGQSLITPNDLQYPKRISRTESASFQPIAYLTAKLTEEPIQQWTTF